MRISITRISRTWKVGLIYKHGDMFGESFPLMREIRQGKLCDVTMKMSMRFLRKMVFTVYSNATLNLQSFSAHRIVLAGSMPHFYASQVRIDNQNVQSLMVAASFLQLTKVGNACADFLISRIHPPNVLGIRHFADSMGCTHLIEAADKYVDQNFAKVVQYEEFLGLDFDELIDLIRRDELNVPTEEIIFEACIKCVKHLEDKRSALFPQVLSKVRVPLLSPQFLTDRVAREELIRSSHQCRDLLDEAKDFHSMPERRGLLQSFRTRQRCGEFVMGQIYAVGGLFGHLVFKSEKYDHSVESSIRRAKKVVTNKN